MGTCTVLLSLLLLIHITFAEQKTCSTGCRGGGNGIFKYQQGHRYEYLLDGFTLATVPGTTEEGVRLQLKANVELDVLSECNQLLRLKNVQVIGPDSKKYGNLKDLETHPVRFNIQNGVIDKEVCAEPGDSEAALNLKRAVVSLFQTGTSQTTHEWDVFGSCPTVVSFIGSGDSLTVVKSRDLNRCYHREDLNHEFQSSAYHVRSEFQSSPVLGSSLRVEQKLKSGIISSVVSHETYLFRPFSNADSGAKTTVETKLTFVSQKAQAPGPASVSVPRTIVFENSHHVDTAGSNVNNILSALRKAANSMLEETKEESAHEFHTFVTALRHSTKDDILTVYGQVQSGAGFSHPPKKLFLDGLFKAGTGDAVEVAVELVQNNEIEGNLAKLWYLSLSFVKQPSSKSLTAVSSLLDRDDLPGIAYLGIGSLAGRYCRNHDCENTPAFNELSEKLSSRLAGGCKVTSRDDEDKVIVALKALGNAGHFSQSVVEKLKQCFTDHDVPSRVRIAALETARSDACKTKKLVLPLLNNVQEDSEIRIKSYLTAVECPCGELASKIKDLLDNERIKQVGSFIVSHLRNLRASTNPEKQLAKEHLSEVRTTRRFPEDFRKYSHNYELSYLLDGLNVGASAESNVIYSQKSFLPRSVSLNLTTEIFGHSFNILELGLRQENLERVLERYFGPKGYLAKHDADEVVKASYDELSDLAQKIQSRLQQVKRSRRSVDKRQIQQVARKSSQNLGPDYVDRDIDLDLSVKLLGSEIGFKNLGGTVDEFSGLSAVDRFFDEVDGDIKRLKSFDEDLRQHFTFADFELTYPTALGLPLRLISSGSVAAHLKLGGNIDIPAIIRDPKNANLKLKVIPSASVEVTGQFVIDAYAIQSGLKLKANLHTATGTDITFKATNGADIDVNIGLPLKEEDILTVKSEVTTTVRERGHLNVDTPLHFKTEVKDYSGCFDQLSSIIGLTFCGTVSVPWDGLQQTNALYPLNGPSILSLKVTSDDVSSYHFHTKLHLQDSYQGTVEVSFDTPNSKTNRKVSLLLERYFEPEKKIAFALTSPWKEVSGLLNVIDTNNENSLNAKFVHDKDVYSVKIGVGKSGGANHQTYRPLLEYRTPSQSDQFTGQSQSGYNVEGTVTVDKSQGSVKYTFNHVSVSTPHGKAIVDGSIGKTPDSYFNDLKLKVGENDVQVKSKFQKVSSTKYRLELGAVTSQYPDFGVNVIWDYHKERDLLENTLAIVHGKDLNSQESRITVSQYLKYTYENCQNFDFSTKNRVTYPLLEVDVKLDGSATPKSVHYDLEGKYAEQKLESELTAKTGIKKTGDFEIEFEVKGFGKSLEFDAKHEIVSPDKSHLVFELDLKPGRKYGLAIDTIHVIKSNNVDVQVSAVAKIEGESVEYKASTGLTVNSDVLEAHLQLGTGSKKYVDISWKFNRATANPAGNIKIYITEIVDATAQYKYVQGKGSALLNIDLPKHGRKIKGTGDLTVTGTSHVASIDLYWNADKDPSKRLHFQTNSDIKKNEIDTRNTLLVLDKKTTLNIKGTLTGNGVLDGQIVGSGDLTLPGGQQLNVKVDRTLHFTPGKVDLDAKIELAARTSQNAQPNTAILEVRVKAERAIQLLDSQVKLALHTVKGEVTTNVIVKNIPQREQRNLELQVSLESPSFKPVNIKLNSEVSQSVIGYKGHGSVGSDVVVDVSGKLNKGLDGRVIVRDDKHVSVVFNLENTAEISLPTTKLKNLKLLTTVDVNIDKNVGRIATKDGLVVNSADEYGLETAVDYKPGSGSSKIVLKLPQDQPRTLTTSWYGTDESEILKRGGTAILNWSGDKEAKFSAEVTSRRDQSAHSIHLVAKAPRLESVELDLETKVLHGPTRGYDNRLILTVNDEKHDVTGKIYESDFPFIPSIDITVVSPKGTSRLYIDLKRKSEKEASGNGEIQWVYGNGGRLTYSGDVKYESIDNFHIKVDADSDALKVNKWHIVLQSKPAKGKKNIQVTATSGGKNILTGRLEYRYEKKEHAFTFDANGNLKYRDQPLRVQVDVALSRLSEANDKETGVEFTLKGNVGDYSINGVEKFTTREVHVGGSVCHKKTNCNQLELLSKLTVIDASEVKHELTFTAQQVLFEDVPDKLLLTSTATRKNYEIDHNVQVQVDSSKGTVTYKSRVYLLKNEAGVVITLPKRVIAAISTYEYNLNRQSKTADIKFDANFWLDKAHKPDVKSGISAFYNAGSSGNGVQGVGEIRVTSSALNKDFYIKERSSVLTSSTNVLSSTVEIDLFRDASQKITVETKILRPNTKDGVELNLLVDVKSEGLNLDITYKEDYLITLKSVFASAYLSYLDVNHAKRIVGTEIRLNHEVVYFKFKGPTEDLIVIDGKVIRTDNVIKTQTTINIHQLTPIEIYAATKVPYSVFFVIKEQNNDDKKLEIALSSNIFEDVGVKADVISGGQRKELAKFLVSFSENTFLKTTVSWSTEEIQAFVRHIEKLVTDAANKIRSLLTDLGSHAQAEFADLANTLNSAIPDLRPVIQSYQQQIKELRDELLIDQILADLSAVFRKLFGGIINSLNEAFEEATKTVNQLLERLQHLRESIVDAYQKLLPQLRASYNKAVTVITDIVETITKFVLQRSDEILDIIKVHEEDIKQLIQIVTDILEDFGRIIGKTIVSVRQEVRDLISGLIEELKALPLYSTIKERYQEILAEIKQFIVPQEILEVVKEFTAAIKDSLPTEELKQLFEAVERYVEKLIKREKVDNVEEIQSISNKLAVALRSVVDLIVTFIKQEDATVPGFVPGVKPLVSFADILRLPRLFIFHLSPLGYLVAGDLPPLSDQIVTYRPRVNPLDWFPPYTGRAVVFEGKEFLTFDNHRYSFKGSCSYVLAEDVVDGNFSVVVTLDRGAFKSVLLTDFHDTIEVLADNTILVNDKSSEYPVQQGDLSAWREYPSVNIKAPGVRIIVPVDGDSFGVYISGFYHGRTQGLLGTLSYEEADDFVKPDNQITTNVNEFINSWKLNKCNDVSGAPPPATRTPQCSEKFNGGSPLSPCFPFIDPKPYREMCDGVVSEAGSETEKNQVACLTARAYVAFCRNEDIPLALPSDCAKCTTAGGTPFDIASPISLKAPERAADVIFLVEQVDSNTVIYNELVPQLIPQLTNDLKSKGITDVHFHLIGYGGFNSGQKWPHHYTTGGKIGNFDGKVKLQFTPPEQPITPDTLANKIRFYLDQVEKEIGLTPLADAAREVFKYPFRAGAAKTVVHITSDTCKQHELFGTIRKFIYLLHGKLAREIGLTINNIVPVEHLTLTAKDGDKVKQIVGFDSDYVYLLRKRSEGNAELRRNLEYTSSHCVDVPAEALGTTFVAQNFIEARGPSKKQFVQVVSQRLAETLSAELYEDCACYLASGRFPTSLCRVTGRKEREALSGVKGQKGQKG